MPCWSAAAEHRRPQTPNTGQVFSSLPSFERHERAVEKFAAGPKSEELAVVVGRRVLGCTSLAGEATRKMKKIEVVAMAMAV